jgi:3'-phosphoadenosine 5'-phosphosulfate sulfotransferase (PAPS reductase)/FAD synthetase
MTKLAIAPKLRDFDLVVINTSSGKDSQTTSELVMKLAARQDYPHDKIIFAHADLGVLEWPGAKELAQEHAKHYNVPFHVVERDVSSSPTGINDFFEYVASRGAWPSSTVRYCTSHWKRDPIAKLVTQMNRQLLDKLTKGKKFRVLNCLGFRAEESPARRKREPWAENTRQTTKTTREVVDWLPIHHLEEDEVWLTIDAAGTKWHPAYDLGMSRLSCRFCIFAPKAQLMLAAKQPENRELLERYVELEDKMGHTFKKDLSLRQVMEAVDAGEEVDTADDGIWNM